MKLPLCNSVKSKDPATLAENRQVISKSSTTVIKVPPCRATPAEIAVPAGRYPWVNMCKTVRRCSAARRPEFWKGGPKLSIRNFSAGGV